MRCHWLRLRATAHPTEDLDRVVSAVQHLSGLDDESFADATEVTPIESHHGGTVHLVECTIKRQRPIRDCLAGLLPKEDGLLPEVPARTDHNGTFHVRFDKQAAFEGRTVRKQVEDAVVVQVRPEVHPASQEAAVAAIEAWLRALA